jgi:hypothetical protein
VSFSPVAVSFAHYFERFNMSIDVFYDKIFRPPLPIARFLTCRQS